MAVGYSSFPAMERYDGAGVYGIKKSAIFVENENKIHIFFQ